MFDESLSVIEQIPFNNVNGIELFIKRDDLIHSVVSGNKYRKLKYNLSEAQQQRHDTLLTFGGAYSNHIAAVAASGKMKGFRTIGVIRGEELAYNYKNNATLKYAETCGMRFKFVSREIYRHKDSEHFKIKLQEEFGDFYLLPEGGTNGLAVKGCEEILYEDSDRFNYICCSVGTGGTLAGLINCSKSGQQVLGFSALKGDFLKDEIGKFALKTNWQLNTDYHFGGYAKINKELIGFINAFKNKYGIQLDPIYTGKMMFGIFDMIERNYFKAGSKIIAIHTGGIQGISGINQYLKKKKLPVIAI